MFSPQCLVKTKACEVEEAQILFCYHTAEVITADRHEITHEERYKKNKKHKMSIKTFGCKLSQLSDWPQFVLSVSLSVSQSVGVYWRSQLEMQTRVDSRGANVRK